MAAEHINPADIQVSLEKQSITQQLQQYAAALESLSAESLPHLGDLVSAEIRFSDPFHCIQGQRRFMAVMSDMFTRLEYVRFHVHQIAPVSDTHHSPGGFLYWTFTANSKITGEFSFNGVSRIALDSAGRVNVHEDYWDSAELYQNIPGLGVLVRWLRRKVSCTI